MRIKIRNHIAKVRSFIFVFLITIILLSGCDFNVNDPFPIISYNDQESGPEASEISGEREISSGRLKIALPLSEECLKYLTYMYIGETAGLFKRTNVSSNGLDLPLDVLENYNIGLVPELVPVPARGYNSEDIRLMTSAGDLPDIFLLNGYDVCNSNVFQSQDLSGEYLNKYIDVENILPEMFVSDIISGKVSGVPLYASATMLYVDYGLLERELTDFSLFSSPLTFQTLQTISVNISDTQRGIFGFYGIKELLAFLPSAVNPFPGSFLMKNGSFEFRNTAFSDTFKLLSEFTKSGSVVDSLDDQQMESFFGNSDPRESGNVAFWIDDSSEFAMWSDDRNIRLLPIPVVDRVSIPIHVYPVAVDPQSSILREATELAIYIALDSDAILFRSRYGTYEGYIPPNNESRIWRETVAEQKAGDDLMSLRDMIAGSHIIDPFAPENTEEIFDLLYDEFFYDIIYNMESLESKLNDIERKAEESLQGG